MRALGGVKLLILDDWGLEPLGPEQRRDLLEIVEDRYGRGATLITSQIPVDRWHDLIGEPTLADAILDRVIHNAHRLQLQGDSLRKKAGQTARRLTRTAQPWRDHIRPAGDPPPRPTSIGTAGRLRSEQVADIKSECPADIIGIRSVPLDRGDGYPQDAAALAGEGLELLRAAIGGRGADDLAGREPPQDALPDPCHRPASETGSLSAGIVRGV